jgi:hypothetical protein
MLTAGLLAGGCAAVPVPVASAPPLAYRKLVSDNGFSGKLRSDASFGPLEISGLQKTTLGEPGDWRTCLRTTKAGKPVYYAIFFVGDAIESMRQSVAIDRCEQEQQFMALPKPTPRIEPKPNSKTGRTPSAR